MCVPPHNFSILGTDILILLAKWGHDFVVGVNLMGPAIL